MSGASIPQLVSQAVATMPMHEATSLDAFIDDLARAAIYETRPVAFSAWGAAAFRKGEPAFPVVWVEVRGTRWFMRPAMARAIAAHVADDELYDFAFGFGVNAAAEFEAAALEAEGLAACGPAPSTETH